MTRPVKRIGGSSARACVIVLKGASLVLCAAWPAAAAEPTIVTGGGMMLHSVSAHFPDPRRFFPGGDRADVVNNNCLLCHSAGMVLTQPKLSSAEWQAEVDKMRNTYKAPIAASDVPAIVDYLTDLGVGK
jgi:cytochrome c5